MASPAELRYSKEHEWVRVAGDRAVIGITAHAAGELGDVVFVDLPAVGATLKQFAVFGAIESVKAVSDLYSPISGTVIAKNETLTTEPASVNTDPYGQGWLLEVEITPNRGDCLSVLGVAREVASITGEEVVLPGASFPEEGEAIGSLVRIDVSDRMVPVTEVCGPTTLWISALYPSVERVGGWLTRDTEIFTSLAAGRGCAGMGGTNVEAAGAGGGA